jgi:hypothetical protein
MSVDPQTKAKREMKIGLFINAFLGSIPLLGALFACLALPSQIVKIITHSSDRFADLGILAIGTLVHAALIYYFWSTLYSYRSIDSVDGAGILALLFILACIFTVNYKMVDALIKRGALGGE